MQLEEYLDEVLRLPKKYKKHIVHYLVSHGYEVDEEKRANNSRNVFLKNGNGKCMIYWQGKSIVIDETSIDLSDDSPTIGSTIKRYTELDDYNLDIEMTVEDNATRYVGRLSCDGQKIGGLFYGHNFYQSINFSDILASRGMDSFITEMSRELAARTTYLIIKRKDFSKENEKIVKLP